MGKTPPVLAGRDDYLRDFNSALWDGPGSHERISIVTGPRGVGKTVLLNEFETVAKPLLAADEGRNPVTFLRRANRIETGMVPIDEVRHALEQTTVQVGVSWSNEALDIAAEATGGYPFMIQLVGQHAFRYRSGDNIDIDAVANGIADARRKLGQLVHEPSLADLSDVDRTFLTAMSVDDGPSRMSDIARRMGVDSQYAGTYRKRLIEAEVIRPTSYGYVDYELPYMREYLRSHSATDAMEQFSFWPE